MKLRVKVATFVALAAAAVFAAMTATGASAAGSHIECQSPPQMVCVVSNPAGIKQVVATGHTDFGDIEYVNQSFTGCPTAVTVILGGDAVRSAGAITFEVATCDSAKLKIASPAVGTSDGLCMKSPDGGGGVQFGHPNACYNNYVVCDQITYECVHLNYCPRNAY